MKRYVLAAAAIGFGATATHAAPPDIRGLWMTPRGAVIEIGRCGSGNLCGTLVSSPAIRGNAAAADAKNVNPALRSRKLKGLTVLWGLKASANSWSGGHMYNPEDGKTYIGSIEPGPGGMLKVKGCVSAVFGINFCGLQQWKRAR